ncbi:hypothetical protein Aduo_018853 [Ancylostoma duodenale]
MVEEQGARISILVEEVRELRKLAAESTTNAASKPAKDEDDQPSRCKWAQQKCQKLQAATNRLHPATAHLSAMCPTISRDSVTFARSKKLHHC